MNCSKFEKQIADFLFGTMEVPERAEFEQHLFVCDKCRQMTEEYRKVKNLFGGLTEQKFPVKLENAILEKIRNQAPPKAPAPRRKGLAYLFDPLFNLPQFIRPRAVAFALVAIFFVSFSVVHSEALLRHIKRIYETIFVEETVVINQKLSTESNVDNKIDRNIAAETTSIMQIGAVKQAKPVISQQLKSADIIKEKKQIKKEAKKPLSSKRKVVSYLVPCVDADGDGYYPRRGCGGLAVDCDDNNPHINPEAIEVCDYIDNNCNNKIDEGLKTIFYRDFDGDGFGDGYKSKQLCSKPPDASYVYNNTDCDDKNADINPQSVEICGNRVDDNCDGNIDEKTVTLFRDLDGDGFGDINNTDKYCSKPKDASYVDNDTDCNDAAPQINKNAIEVCDGLDNNCDGAIDNDCPFIYVDDDYPAPVHQNCSERIGAANDPYCNIQDGIDIAGTYATVLVAAGTYNENIDFKGKTITVRAEKGAEHTIIDGNRNGSVVIFNSGESQRSVLDGFTLVNGNGAAINSNGDTYGGGILCLNSSSPSITDCIISDNSAMFGGGIACYNFSSPIISGCTVIGNSTSNWGGGILCWNSSSPKINNCTISVNKATDGGGIHCDQSFPLLTQCTISGNSASNWGGGISCKNSSPSLNSCTISGNSSGNWGGGISCVYSSSPKIANCIITGNRSASDGGAIVCWNSSMPTITNCTISGNLAAGEGGGIYCKSNSSPKVSNTIFWGNKASSSADEIYLADISRSITYSNIDPSHIAGPGTPVLSGNINTDPLFVDPRPASDAPTSAGDYHLTSNSPCIDMGTGSGELPSVDIDGDSRPRGGGIDIGSDEY